MEEEEESKMEVTEKEDEKKVKREEERQARRGRFREGWGEREDTLLMPQRLWAGRLTLTFIPQSSSSRSFPRTHPTAHRPGEVYECGWGSLPTMKFPGTALFISWKHIHQRPRRASERVVIRALPTKVLSLICLFIFPEIGVLHWSRWTLPTSKSNN